jgi:hypothetical protein
MNTADGAFPVIAGGESNTATANYPVIGGGYSNRVMAPYSTIGGGESNTVKWGLDPQGMRTPTEYATIGGGRDNLVGNDYMSCFEWAPGTCDCGTISAGCANSAIGPGCTVGGGYGNTSCMEFWNPSGPG